jgi:hypothetical protein
MGKVPVDLFVRHWPSGCLSRIPFATGNERKSNMRVVFSRKGFDSARAMRLHRLSQEQI